MTLAKWHIDPGDLAVCWSIDPGDSHTDPPGKRRCAGALLARYARPRGIRDQRLRRHHPDPHLLQRCPGCGCGLARAVRTPAHAWSAGLSLDARTGEESGRHIRIATDSKEEICHFSTGRFFIDRSAFRTTGRVPLDSVGTRPPWMYCSLAPPPKCCSIRSSHAFGARSGAGSSSLFRNSKPQAPLRTRSTPPVARSKAGRRAARSAGHAGSAGLRRGRR